METFALRTPARRIMVDVTRQVQEAVAAAGLMEGAALIQVSHTTAAVTINEGYDPDVAQDVMTALGALIPAVRFAHAEGNSDAHLLAVLVGGTQAVPVRAGRLCLGRWQRIFFCEFDGPRTREVRVQPLNADAG